jgi:hypothetical protein
MLTEITYRKSQGITAVNATSLWFKAEELQQADIWYATGSSAASGDDPLVDLIDAHEQALDDIGIVSIWLCHSL